MVGALGAILVSLADDFPSLASEIFSQNSEIFGLSALEIGMDSSFFYFYAARRGHFNSIFCI